MKKKPEPNKQKQPVEYINGRRVEYVQPEKKSITEEKAEKAFKTKVK